jgi:predicted CopG family antitoxin
MFKHMSFKTLTIKEQTYNKLLAMKQKGESFSDLFERLCKNNIEILKKTQGTIDFSETEKEALLEDIRVKRSERRWE